MIEFRGVTKRYGGLLAVDGVSFSLNNGEVVGLVGFNGAGKTTLIKVAAGVLRPTSGTVLVDGYDVVKQKEEASRRVGWVPQDPALEERIRAKDYLVYLAGFYGVTGRQADELAQRVLDRVGLSKAAERRLSEYSQGMRKRFALAASMISDPGNFLFDEVLNDLDHQDAAFFRSFFQEVKADGGAVLISSRTLSDLKDVADKVVLLHRGKVATVKAMTDVIAEARVALLVEVANPDDRIVSVLSDFGEVTSVRPNVFSVRGKASPEYVSAELARKGYRVIEVLPVVDLDTYLLIAIRERHR